MMPTTPSGWYTTLALAGWKARPTRGATGASSVEVAFGVANALHRWASVRRAGFHRRCGGKSLDGAIRLLVASSVAQALSHCWRWAAGGIGLPA
jgi:hypothetical protein